MPAGHQLHGDAHDLQPLWTSGLNVGVPTCRGQRSPVCGGPRRKALCLFRRRRHRLFGHAEDLQSLVDRRYGHHERRPDEPRVAQCVEWHRLRPVCMTHHSCTPSTPTVSPTVGHAEDLQAPLDRLSRLRPRPSLPGSGQRHRLCRFVPPSMPTEPRTARAHPRHARAMELQHRRTCSSPSIANGMVFFSIFSTDVNDVALEAFDANGNTNCSGTPKTCRPLWTGPTRYPVTGDPAIANGKVYDTDNLPPIPGGPPPQGDLYAWVLPTPTTSVAVPSNHASVSGGHVWLDASASAGVTSVQ